MAALAATWPKEAWTYIGSANNWAGMAVDRARGIVYVPTANATLFVSGTAVKQDVTLLGAPGVASAQIVPA